MNRDTLFRMTRLVEAKDHVTAAHTWRVVLYTQALAESMGIETPVVKRLMRGAALHDLGKIDIPSRILNKPARLTESEFQIIRQHPLLGYHRLKQMGERDRLVLELVRSHHERLDGSGYPDGLAGDAIPLAARLFAVIDSFDAMTSIRPYRREVDKHAARRALAELNAYAGQWYCHDTVRRFTDLLESGRLNWIQKHFNDFRSLGRLSTPENVDQISEVTQRHRVDVGMSRS